MDAPAMYPKGFHPVETDLNRDMRGSAPHHSRFTNPRPVKYYYVDFGISSQFTPEQDHTSRLVVGVDGLDDQVPELSKVTPYDPFKVDVFILGNYFKKTILNVRLIFLLFGNTILKCLSITITLRFWPLWCNL